MTVEELSSLLFSLHLLRQRVALFQGRHLIPQSSFCIVEAPSAVLVSGRFGYAPVPEILLKIQC
jgi:hypothetical protein